MKIIKFSITENLFFRTAPYHVIIIFLTVVNKMDKVIHFYLTLPYINNFYDFYFIYKNHIKFFYIKLLLYKICNLYLLLIKHEPTSFF